MSCAAAVPLIGFAGAPFTMATYLVEGRGTKQFAEIKRLLFSDPGTAHALLATCAETVGRYLAAQVEAGAQAAMLFDTWASLLAPSDYRAFALPYVRRVFADVDTSRPRAWGSTFRASTTPAMPRAGSMPVWPRTRPLSGWTGAWTWIVPALRSGSGSPCRAISIPRSSSDPPTASKSHAADVIRRAGSTGHIFNLGHGILPETPPDHARYSSTVSPSSRRRGRHERPP